jgi:iron complex outermembrane receptor protein
MPAGPAFARLRVGGGAFGTSRASLAAGGSRGDLSGLVALTRYESSGFRQHSGSLATQFTLAANAVLSPTWLARGRYFFTGSPRAENPGALTGAELAVRPDSAAAANLLRGADKSVTQHQAGVTFSRVGAGGGRVDVTLFGLVRDLDNPLATAPPGPPGPTVGTHSAIDRVAGGVRLQADQPIRRWRGRIGIGLDLQAMRDDRVNRRAVGGVPSDTVVADQRETVAELGPFLTLHLEPDPAAVVTAAVRYDRMRFRARDRFFGDGGDQSGERSMGAASGSVGLSVGPGAWTGWTSLSSAFETPTTTELANRPGGLAGFNEDLDPQRAANIEVGLRRTGRIGGSLVLYRTAVRNAIVQAREVNGRAYFENAGRLRHRGAEIGVDARRGSWLRGRLSYAYTDSRFIEYRLRDGTVVDTLDGNRVPGIPRHAARLQLLVERQRWSVEVEQQVVSDQVADDRNAIVIAGWRTGVTTARVAARLPLATSRAALELSPFLAIHNLFDRRYVGSVNVNGFGGRVFEPAPGRWAFVGAEIAWARQRGP